MGTTIDRITATEVIVHAREGYVDRPAFGASIFDKASKWLLLRQKTSVPLALHSGGQLHVALANHCCDFVNLGGSPGTFMANAHMAACFNVLCWHGSGLKLGILDAYRLHLAAATRTCVVPGDSVGHLIRQDDLIEEALVVEDGAIRVPAGPGLGVTPDRSAIEHHACSQLVLTN